MPIKAIIFDFDGVFVPAETFSARLENEYGISRELLRPFFQGAFQKCLIGEADLKREMALVYRDWGWRGTLDELLSFWFVAEGSTDERFISLIKVLKSKNIFCYLATNQEKYRTEYLKNDLGLGKLFDKIFSSAYLNCKKPEKIFYEKVFASIGGGSSLKKEEIFFIDDDAKNIAGAADFGFQTFLYHDFESFVRAVKDKISNKK